MELGGTRVAFLPRHGRGHRLLPTEVPSRANIWALKTLGVEQILSVSAVGSLAEDYHPGEFVVCDQLIDRTRSRENSFFGDGAVGHVVFADPFCRGMGEAVRAAIGRHGFPVHPAGTLVTMEGPLFSTRAESRLYRCWGAHLIGMTALPEAKLAREAEICYAVVAMVTDYDCWRDGGESVTLEMVLKVMEENTRRIQQVIPDALAGLRGRPTAPAGTPRPGPGDRPGPDPGRDPPPPGAAVRQVLGPPMKAGFVAVVGRPSSGKSTLLNRLCGHKVSIVSPMPQTTRNRVRGIRNSPEGQLVFIDTPGWHRSDRKFNLRLQELVQETLQETEVVLYLADVTRAPGEEEGALLDLLAPLEGRLVVGLNKTDRTPNHLERFRQEIGRRFPAAPLCPLSGLTGEGLDGLLAELLARVPEGEPMYPPEYYTDQTPEFRITEIVREKVILQTRQEVPHHMYVEVADLEQRPEQELLWARVFIFVERESQKGIVVGKGGRRSATSAWPPSGTSTGCSPTGCSWMCGSRCSPSGGGTRGC